MPTHHDDHAAADRPLERRSSSGQPRRVQPASSRERLLVLTWSAFKQVLIKYIRRQTRNERAFCLAKVEILEYGRVLASTGSQAASAVCRAATSVCIRNLRDVDRLCEVKSGQLLLLLPETDEPGARSAAERIAKAIAAKKIKYHQTGLRASCAVTVVDSRTCDPDPDELLRPFGYSFSEDLETATDSKDVPGVAPSAKPPFWGEFAQWRQRYRAAMEVEQSAAVSLDSGLRSGRSGQGPARGCADIDAGPGPELYPGAYPGAYLDLWRDGRRVDVRVLSAASTGPELDLDSIHAVARRARVLAAIDHPGLASPRDYHLRDSRFLYLIYDRQEVTTVSEFIAGREFGWAAALEWAVQICNTLIYLQGLIPPLVPPPLTPERLAVSGKGALILSDFEVPYLFPTWHRPSQVSDSEAEDVWQGRPVAAYLPVIRNLSCLLSDWLGATVRTPEPLARVVSDLSSDPLPRHLNTVYKVRAALKELGDALRVGATLVSGGFDKS